MNAPKLFEFPDGGVTDLNQVFAISNIYQQGSSFYIKMFFKHTDTTGECRMGESRHIAEDNRRALIMRWAQDK